LASLWCAWVSLSTHTLS